MPDVATAARLQLRSARHLLRRQIPVRSRLGGGEDRLVFILGSPRSGTTFLGRAIGSVPGFVELGEVPPYKAALPELFGLPPAEASRRMRRTLTTVRRLGLVASLRGVEHTPETSHLAERVAAAFPDARFVHIVRDGRDVVSSLLDTGWFDGTRSELDDVDFEYGAKPRFWVEPERRDEFSRVSDARRAAWAWRRYVTAARAADCPLLELRYERMVVDPGAAAAELARFLDAPEAPLAERLGHASGSSIGRHERDLAPDQLDDVMAESGALLRELGYV